MHKVGECIRQGDVLLILTQKSAVTKDHKLVPLDNGRVILAYGESSMHYHTVRGPGVSLLYREGISDRVLTVMEDMCTLVTEGGEIAPGVPRHVDIHIQKGTYIVRIQREWAGEEVRNVQD